MDVGRGRGRGVVDVDVDVSCYRGINSTETYHPFGAALSSYRLCRVVSCRSTVPICMRKRREEKWVTC